MIDWEEVLEDVNWKRGIILTVIGLLVIGGVIFVLLDYWKFKELDTQLKADLKEIERFHGSWDREVLDAKQIKDLEAEAKKFEDALQEKGIRLPVLDPAPKGKKNRYQSLLEGELADLAAAKKIAIASSLWLDEKTVDYAIVSPVEINITGATRSAAEFLSSIYGLKCPTEANPANPCPVADKSGEQSLEGPKKVRFEFYSFDQDTWDRINDCEVSVDPPVIKSREGKSLLFGGGLADLRARVDQEAASMAQVKTDVLKSCAAAKTRDRVKAEVDFIQKNNLGPR